MPVKEIESFAEFKKIIDSDKVSVIDYWAEWCGSCKTMAPLFNKFAETTEFKDIDFYSVDTEKHEDVMMESGIKSMPSFLAFKSGNKIAEAVGTYPQRLQEMLKSAAAKATPGTATETTAPAEKTSPKDAAPAPTATSTAPPAVPVPTPAADSAPPARNIREIKSMEEWQIIKASNRVSIIDYWAEWCAPCKMMTPVFKKFAVLDEFKDVDFYTCDVEEQEDVMYLAVVKSMPSFMAYYGDQKIGEAIGTYPQRVQDLCKLAAKVAKEGPSAIPPAEAKPAAAAAAPPAEATPADSTATKAAETVSKPADISALY